MAIQPVNTSTLIESIAKKQELGSGRNELILFKDFLDDAINNVLQTESTARIDAVNAVSGNMDDLHTLTINIAKADLALQLFVGVRNKALEAYNEIMRITL
jgi:flagellar hook-basal body complex protein FliE